MYSRSSLIAWPSYRKARKTVNGRVRWLLDHVCLLCLVPKAQHVSEYQLLGNISGREVLL